MRLVDIEPMIESLDEIIKDFQRSGNGFGETIFSTFKDRLLSLPVVKKKP